MRAAPRWLGEALLLAMLLALWVAGVLAIRREPVVYQLDLTRPTLDQRFYFFGLYQSEQNAEFTYRWTSDHLFVQLPAGYHMTPQYIATVRAQAGLPQPNPLTFLGNERPLASVLPTGEFRVYQLLLPGAPPGDSELRLALQTAPRTQAGDPRALGVVLTSIELRGVPARDWTVLLLLPLGLGLLWTLARWRGASLAGALLLCGPLAAALLALYMRASPAPLPYSAMAAWSIAAAAAAILVAREALARMALALLGALVSFSGMLWPSWLSDDAFISFHYAQNLVAGHGLVYNPGERVEGYTNFLYTLLAALVIALGGDPVAWAYRSGVGFALALLLLSYGLAARLIGPRWALVAALLLATSQSLLLHSARGGGLETGFFALLLLSAVALYLRWLEGGCASARMGAAVGLTLALATLTRPEGALLLAITGLHYLVYDLELAELRRPAALLRRKLGMAALVGPYLLVVLPFFLWRYSYYGDLLPNTFYAKTGGGLRAVARGLGYSWGFAQTMGGPLLLLALLGWIEPGWRAALRGWRGYLLLLLTIYTAYIIAVGGDHFRGERFFVPLVALIAILFADGLAQLTRLALRRPALRLIAPALLVVLLSGYSLYALTRTRSIDHIIRGMDESVWIWREIGWWMADHSEPDESIAVLGAGAIAYYGQRTTVDMLGLTDRYIARVEVPDMGAGAAGHEKRAPLYVIDERRPTYIPQLWEDYFEDRTPLYANYELITITTRYGRELAMWRRLP